MSATISKPTASAAKTKKGDGWLHQMGIGVARLRQGAAALLPGHSSSGSKAQASPGQPAAAVPAQPAVNKQPDLSVVHAPVAAPAQQPAPAAANPQPAAAAPPSTPPEQTAHEEALQKIKQATDLLSSSRPGSETLKLKPMFDGIVVPPSAAPIQDYAKALADLKPKLDAAVLVAEASNYDGLSRLSQATVRKAGIYALQSGPVRGHETAHEEAADLSKKAREACDDHRYDDAFDFIVAARKKAEPICRHIETQVAAERNKPMFARAERLIGAKRVAPELDGPKQGYERAAAEYEAALRGTDHALTATKFGAKKEAASKVLLAGQKATVEAWFDGHMRRMPAKAAGSQPPAPGAAGIADRLATMPGLPDMGELETFAAMARAFKVPLETYASMVQGTYGVALKEGVRLDLTPSQVAAIYAYSGTAYSQVNGLLRKSLDTSTLSPAQLDMIKVQAALIQQALERLPELPVESFPLYRWETPHGTYLQTRYQVKSPVFTIDEFWSTGAGGGSAVGVQNTEILVWGKKKSKAKDIALVTAFGSTEGGRADGHKLKGQAAGEVLFPPGTKFKTVKSEKLDDPGKVPLARMDSRNADSLVDIRYRIEVQEV